MATTQLQSPCRRFPAVAQCKGGRKIREVMREGWTGRAVQLNCYDIIRGDPSSFGGGGDGGKDEVEGEGRGREGEGVKEGGRVRVGLEIGRNCRCNHSFFTVPWYHLTSSFRDLRLFLELAPWFCFVGRFLFHLWIATLIPRLVLFRYALPAEQLRYPGVTWAQFSAPMTGRADRATNASDFLASRFTI